MALETARFQLRDFRDFQQKEQRWADSSGFCIWLHHDLVRTDSGWLDLSAEKKKGVRANGRSIGITDSESGGASASRKRM
jgi:hypothetical protein